MKFTVNKKEIVAVLGKLQGLASRKTNTSAQLTMIAAERRRERNKLQMPPDIHPAIHIFDNVL